MSEGEPHDLLLAGYVPLLANGFALPCFASRLQSNTWYTARCSVDGDHCGSVVGFDAFASSDIIMLPERADCRVALGDLWHDVLLWQGKAYIGTPDSIVRQLGEHISELATAAPFTLLDLAMASERLDRATLQSSAYSYFLKKWGAARAELWLSDTFTRQQLMIEAKRLLLSVGIHNASDIVRKLEVHSRPDGSEVHLPDELRQLLLKTGLREAFARRVAGFAAGTGVYLKPVAYLVGEEPSLPDELAASDPASEHTVLCFTPKGELIELPRGSTLVDFAYALHTDVGDTTVGAKVNGRVVPLRTRLQNGDQVEILRSKAQEPDTAWEAFVITRKARAAIRRHIRRMEREELIEMGLRLYDEIIAGVTPSLPEEAVHGALEHLNIPDLESLFVALAKRSVTDEALIASLLSGGLEGNSERYLLIEAGLKLYDEITARMTLPLPEASLNRALKRLKIPNRDALFIELARQSVSAEALLDALLPHATEDNRALKTKYRQSAIPIEGLMPGVAFQLADCCHPMPIDRIVGVRRPDQSVEVHIIDCAVLKRKTHSEWIDIAWPASANAMARLQIMVANEPGALMRMINLISGRSANITDIHLQHRNGEVDTFAFDLQLDDLAHLTIVREALHTVKGVTSVNRVKYSGTTG